MSPKEGNSKSPPKGHALLRNQLSGVCQPLTESTLSHRRTGSGPSDLQKPSQLYWVSYRSRMAASSKLEPPSSLLDVRSWTGSLKGHLKISHSGDSNVLWSCGWCALGCPQTSRRMRCTQGMCPRVVRTMCWAVVTALEAQSQKVCLHHFICSHCMLLGSLWLVSFSLWGSWGLKRDKKLFVIT